MSDWLNLALRISKKSPHRKHKMAAVIISGGRVLSLATNGADRYQHAEFRALVRGRDFKDAIIVIARANGRCSMPCKKCRKIIEESGIDKMIYIDKNGSLVVEKV